MSTNLSKIVQASMLLSSALLVRHRTRAQTRYASTQQFQTAHSGNQPSRSVELAVKMHCSSCEESVRRVLEEQSGVDSFTIDLSSETVLAQGTFATDDVVRSLQNSGREVRVVGSGTTSTRKVVPEEIGSDQEWSAAVAEFKGNIYGHGSVIGVIRMTQVSPEECLVETHLTGLKPETPHQVAIHEFGDLRNVPESVGKQVIQLTDAVSSEQGELATRQSSPLKVWETIGRSVVIYEEEVPFVATVAARSAGIGANPKRLCTCDGTVIW